MNEQATRTRDTVRRIVRLATESNDAARAALAFEWIDDLLTQPGTAGAPPLIDSPDGPLRITLADDRPDGSEPVAGDPDPPDGTGAQTWPAEPAGSTGPSADSPTTVTVAEAAAAGQAVQDAAGRMTAESIDAARAAEHVAVTGQPVSAAAPPDPFAGALARSAEKADPVESPRDASAADPTGEPSALDRNPFE